MKGLPTAAVVALAVLSASGCGTVCNLASGDPQIYGGPQADIMMALTPAHGAGDTPPSPAREGDATAEGFNGSWPFLLVLADIPLSLVGDTMTLPLTVYLRQNKHPKPDRAADRKAATLQGPAQPFWPEVVNMDPPAATSASRPADR
jgi:uncharacterized protein YceK